MERNKLYQYCKIQKKVVPVDQVMVEVPANIKHGVMSDDMEPTQHPIDMKYYTSKSKFRSVTKAYGYEEVGNEYENGYDPSKRQADENKELIRKIKQQIIERWKS